MMTNIKTQPISFLHMYRVIIVYMNYVLMTVVRGSATIECQRQKNADDIQYQDRISFQFPLYNAIKWQEYNGGFHYANMTLVYGQLDRQIFDYCDLSKYNTNDIMSLLSAQGVIGINGLAANWAFLFDTYIIERECFTNSPKDNLELFWESTLLTRVQALGK